jgi:hypothetical protein
MSDLILTKAETLAYLKGSVSKCVVDDFLWFSVADWQKDSSGILDRIQIYFQPSKQLIIRSSAKGEDKEGGNLAGAMYSEWEIEPTDRKGLTNAVQKVIASFSKNGRILSSHDQIIVQLYVTDPKISGVVLTWDLWHDRPYYVINYDGNSSRTDLVTSGRKGSAVRVFKGGKTSHVQFPWDVLISSIKEIEELFPNKIVDAEFAIDSENVVHVFQVRSLGDLSGEKQECRILNIGGVIEELELQFEELFHASRSLPGDATIFSDMADWNPAEMLGARPNNLDVSLYRFLITKDLWSRSRETLGYSNVQPFELMLLLGDKPYIDTRVSFNSLLPSKVSGSMRDEIVNCCLETLGNNPGLHDKVEFEIAVSCYDFGLRKRLQSYQNLGLGKKNSKEIETILWGFTDLLVRNSTKTINEDLFMVEGLKRKQALVNRPAKNHVAIGLYINRVLLECREQGVYPFVRLARLAFIGLSLLNSLVKEGHINEDFNRSFLRSLDTIASKVQSTCSKIETESVAVSSFLGEYGHLRPRTYDIMAPRYDQMPEGFWCSGGDTINDPCLSMTCDPDLRKIDEVLGSEKFSFKGEELLLFIKSAVEAREYAKFIFTKSVSEALEGVASYGDLLGFSRSELSLLPLETLLKCTTDGHSEMNDVKRKWRETIDRNAMQKKLFSAVALPPVLKSKSELCEVPYPEAYPNFVSEKLVQGLSVFLSQEFEFSIGLRSEIKDKIVLIDNADPGYDWIFSSAPKGLITKYGGAGSHMAIRCAQFGVPAAIGCGETVFERLRGCGAILLNCDEGVVLPL